MWGLALVLSAALFPFDFSFDEQVRISDEFAPGATMKTRGNDLIIGADAATGQSFTGEIGELRIYRDALAPADIAKEAERGADVARGMHGVAASYSFAEPARAKLRDDSGNGNHGKFVGEPKWITDEGRGALSFRPGQYALVPNSPSIDIGGRSITISMHVVLKDSPSDGVIIAKPWWQRVQAPPYYQYAVEFGSREKSLDFYFADTKGRERGPFSVHPPIGAWTHIVFVYDGAVRGYVDGRELLVTNAGELWDLADILVNLLLFVPLGFGLAAVAQSRGMPPAGAIPLLLVLGGTLSFGVEVLQCWLPAREPSWIDVAANSASSALGAGLYLAGNPAVLDRFKRLLLDRSRVRDDT